MPEKPGNLARYRGCGSSFLIFSFFFNNCSSIPFQILESRMTLLFARTNGKDLMIIGLNGASDNV